MKLKFLLCFALILATGCAGTDCYAAPGDDVSNTVQAAHNYVTVIVKTNWTDTSVTVYRATGGPIQLPARQARVTELYGPYTNDFVVTAFVDPETGNAWLGSYLPWARNQFYFETKESIYFGQVYFMAAALNGFIPHQYDVINGNMAYGEVQWWGSLVPRGKTAEDVIQQCSQKGGQEWAITHLGTLHAPSLIENSLVRVENGLNPWLFIAEGRGPVPVTTIERIRSEDGKLRLDLKGPDGPHASGSPGVHTASVWIDPGTWKVVKVVQDSRP